MPRTLLRHNFACLLSIILMAVLGCSRAPSSTATVTFSIAAEEAAPASPTPTPIEPPGSSLGSQTFALSSDFDFNDVNKIRITVRDTATNDALYVNYDLQKSAGQWTGTLPFLPKDTSLTFIANAFNTNTELFNGSTTQTLTIDNASVAIRLVPVTNGAHITLPRINRILVPAEFLAGQSGNITFDLEANTGEHISYASTAAPGGGSFSPPSGAITLTGTAGSFVVQYAAPSPVAETEYTHTIKVTNEEGNAVSTTFKTRVKPLGSTGGVLNTDLSVVFNPVITSLTANRVQGTANVIWTPSVADDGPQSALTYLWSFAPNGAFAPAPAFIDVTANPATLQNYTTLLQGSLTLAVTDGSGGVTTLSYDLTPGQFPDNPVQPGALDGLNSIRGGESHTCAMLNNGVVRCWGRSNHGQLGYGNTFSIGDTEYPFTAGDVPLAGTASRIAVGANHTCALLNSGFVRCWGLNTSGQLGYATTENVGDGEAISSYGYVNLGGIATKLTAGGEHTCALMNTGKVRCWGRNNVGQLGYGHINNIGDNEQPWTEGDVQVVTAVENLTVVDIEAGDYHTCALLSNGKVRCWGYNGYGQLGYGHTNNIGNNETPASAGDINLGGNATQLSAGSNFTCAVLTTGNLRCWGYDGYGQLGYSGTGYPYYRPAPNSGDVAVGDHVLQVTTGQNHTCALLASGGLKCWGNNAHGELGYGNTANLSTPPASTVQVSGATAFQVAAGQSHTCALLSTGKARCWGYGLYGQLGYGTTQSIGDTELPSAAGDIQIQAP